MVTLVAGFNPFEKYARQNWIISPIFGVNKPKMFELPPPRLPIGVSRQTFVFWAKSQRCSIEGMQTSCCSIFRNVDSQEVTSRILRGTFPPPRKNKGLNIYRTLPKFNMEPKNDGLPKGISYSRVPFSDSMLNFGRLPIPSTRPGYFLAEKNAFVAHTGLEMGLKFSEVFLHIWFATFWWLRMRNKHAPKQDKSKSLIVIVMGSKP